MRKLFLAFLLSSLASCSTTSQMQSQTVTPAPSKSSSPSSLKTSTTSNEKLIAALVAAPNLYVQYVEDGAADDSVLAIYPDLDGYATNPIAKEVKDIVALGDKAIPLLIEHLEDTRPTSATVLFGGYLTDKPVQVPVGFICLDILTSIIERNNNHIFVEDSADGFCGDIKDGYCFRPDDYKAYADGKFKERPIVRIVKANWQKAYRDRKVKYDYKAAWK
jgi:hypothetical protein